jgi:hypothetical protein
LGLAASTNLQKRDLGFYALLCGCESGNQRIFCAVTHIGHPPQTRTNPGFAACLRRITGSNSLMHGKSLTGASGKRYAMIKTTT